MNLCVIPARGGSKRIPGKNIKDFCGAPIISYSIKAAIASECFDAVIVSTDDDAIAEIARSFGADTPFVRPTELADDFTSAGAVTSHAAQWYRDNGQDFDYICTLYATAPFVTGASLAEALQYLKAHPDFTFCFTATEFPAPIQRALKRLEDGAAAMFAPENYYKRSQDLEPAYHDAGQFYWGKTDGWIANLPIFLEKSLMYLMPRSRVEDIDTLEDWTRAEGMFRILNGLAGTRG